MSPEGSDEIKKTAIFALWVIGVLCLVFAVAVILETL